jgi:hypothetical protein
MVPVSGSEIVRPQLNVTAPVAHREIELAIGTKSQAVQVVSANGHVHAEPAVTRFRTSANRPRSRRPPTATNLECRQTRLGLCGPAPAATPEMTEL